MSTVQESASAIRQRWNRSPSVGIILGTGLGNVASQIDVDCTIAYGEIPQFPRSTALSHQGKLVCGLLKGVPTAAMAGRCHLYEGYSLDDVTLPVRVMHALGVKLLIVSNASGGLNPQFRSGEIMVMTDHINLLFRSGRSPSGGVAVLGRSAACCYDSALADRALGIARRENFVAHRGVYVAMTGPNYETRAEYRFLRRIGGDAVGMSTVPEVLTAARLGLRVLALSTIANVATPDAPQKVDAQEVVDGAARAEPNLSKIVLDAAEFGA